MRGMRNFLYYGLIVLLTLLCGTVSYAGKPAGKAVAVRGDVYAIGADQVRRALKQYSPIYEGDTLVTGVNASAQLYFTDNSIVALPAKSRLRIDSYRYKDAGDNKNSYAVTLVEGAFRTVTGAIGQSSPSAYQAKSGASTIGVRGTFFATELSDQGQLVCVKRGKIDVNNAAGHITLGDHERYGFAIVPGSNKAPKGSDAKPEFLFNQFSDQLYSGQTKNISNGYNGHKLPVLDVDAYYESDAYLYLDYANRLTPAQVRTLIRRGHR